MGGLQKLTSVLGRLDTYTGGLRINLIFDISDMHKNDVGKNMLTKLMMGRLKEREERERERGGGEREREEGEREREREREITG
jgi:hypothetical protein